MQELEDLGSKTAPDEMIIKYWSKSKTRRMLQNNKPETRSNDEKLFKILNDNPDKIDTTPTKPVVDRLKTTIKI